MTRARAIRRNVVKPTGPVPPERRCQIPDCDQAGAFPAPKSRDRITDYYWFCLDHVRYYNAAWNFYRDMSAAEIEAHIRHDTTWRRPSWRIGGGQGYTFAGLRDEYGLFENDEGVAEAEAAGTRRNGRQAPTAPPGAAQALAVLDLTLPVDFAQIKKRYKDLAKRHHPDANGGDRASEERLKLINQAYTRLKTVYCP